MKKGFLPSILIASCALLLTVQSCKKESTIGIDNDKVVKTPYSLYVANSEGWLLNSTDGTTYSSIFPPDGYAPNLIVTSGPNLLFLKKNLFLSENNGNNFNPVYTQTRNFPWQTMAYDVASQNTLYVTANVPNGVAVSKDHGKTWETDQAWDPNIPTVFTISSFSALSNGAAFAYSNLNNILFKKDNGGSTWHPVTMEGLFPVDGTNFYLTSNTGTLFLTDYNGIGGVWTSTDQGFHWTRITQSELPYFHHWNCSASPNGGSSLLVGTDSTGVYRADYQGRFVSSNIGLEKNIVVYSMTVKRNIYKNDVTRNYVFIATSKGVYRSEDNGLTWDKVSLGEFDGDYRAAY